MAAELPEPYVPVGATEVAALLGVKPHTVHTWRQRPATGMPAPRGTVSGYPAWDAAEVLTWAKATGRAPAEG
jgi:predicted DNA-binding transcriptional regulator AlpA